MPTVLIADDDFINLARMQEAIKSAGYKVISVSDGAEAYVICGTDPVDFVLTDNEMPKMTGLELGGKINGNIPFAIMSAAGIESRALQVGATAFFKKPVNIKALLVCIKAHTRQ